MLRIVKTALSLALIVLSGVARAEMDESSEQRMDSARVNIDSVLSIGATTALSDNDAIVTVPGKGRLVATANADIFCSGEETARQLTINVEAAGEVLLDFCEAHLERRDVVVKFMAQ